jgi:hypothetical protein
LKNILYTLIFFFCSGLFAQEEKINSQKEYFEKAETALNNSDGLSALYAYYSVCIFELNTEIERISKKRIDSLLLIYQKQNFERVKGKWKLKQLKTKLFDYEYIKITDSEILFYSKNNSSLPSRVEKIKFVQYNLADIEIPISKVEFQNNEIWSFSIRTKEGEDRLYPVVKRSSDGTYHILVDERSIIRNSVERKKALEEDIYTYYLREN